MGIKFNCQSCGKKLNVKAFLAGKRGICPHCNSKIVIPDESGAAPAMDAEAESPAFAAAATAAASAGMEAGGAVPTATAPRAVPTGPAPGFASHGGAAPAFASPTGMPTAAAPAAAAPAAAVAPVAMSTVGDPIAEAPNAVWYVRPSSGGQFGPAGGDIMRRWITEGRVAADSLVWREGWPDWQPATELFPSLATKGESPSQGAGNPLGLESAGSGSSTGGYRRPRKSNSMVVAMLVVLAIASVGLLVALIAVLSNWQS